MANSSKTLDRIIGVDIAKIVAMVLVVAVHLNGFGLPYLGDGKSALAYTLTRTFVGAVAMACINIFAIASGYVGIAASFKLSRIVKLWLQVVFTGLAVLVCLDCFTGIRVTTLDYMKACIPIAKGQYWYMTAYFMLCFLMPIMNAGIKALEQKQLVFMLMLFLGVICGESLLCSGVALGVASGYSFEWLAVLYIAGAYIRLYDPIKAKPWQLAACACICAMIAGWMPGLMGKLQLAQVLKVPRLLDFGGYTSPFTVAIAICIFMICLKVRLCSNRLCRLVSTLSATTLGVYLIHVQPVCFRHFGPFCKRFAVFGLWSYLATIVSLTLAFYFGCTLLDYLRLRLFAVLELGILRLTDNWRLLRKWRGAGDLWLHRA